MSPLFRKSEEKQVQEAAGKAAADRLAALAPQDLALQLMPVFGPGGPKGRGPNGGLNILQIGIGLLEPIPGGTHYLPALQEQLREGLQALEHAELILRATRRDGTWYSPTRLGETALADGTVQQQLQGHG